MRFTKSLWVLMVGMLVLVAVGMAPEAARGQSGIVIGRVTDSQNGESLPGASIRIAGTALGAATDLDGAYRIPGAPVGRQTLVVSYVGYLAQELIITVLARGTVRQDVVLSFGVVEGEEIVVTAQLEGQARAINQQLASNTIVNIVSSDRIQELPDQNAAESVGRLPGIAVQRNAGEGQKVVIRGLSPKFNAITVNGERIPATDGEDRSVDLSMISPDVLAGIEVFKALTPDKDADAIGGTVNFVLRKASERRKGTVRFQTGYNAHEEALGQFKGSASLSDRFFDNRLGALVTGSVQRADRSSDVLDAEYEFIRGPRDDQDQALLNIAKLNLADRLETRDRFSSGLTLDYDLNNGGLLFSTFWGRTDRDELRRRKRYRVADGRTELDLRDRDITILLLTNSLSGRHTFRWGEVHWRASRSRTLRKQPFGHFARFEELAAFTPDLIDDQGPELIPAGAENKLDATTFKFANFLTERVADRNLTGQIDLTIPFTLGRRVAGYLKAGGKHRDKHRDRDRDERQTPFAGTDAIGQETGLYSLSSEGKILLENFVDEDFDAGSFLEGRYEFGPGLDVDRVNDFWEMFKDRYQINRVALLDNYVAAEAITAGYVMAEINLGQHIMLLPGFRYESTDNTYDASVGQLRADLGAIGEIADTTGGQSYGEFLPMVHLRLKLTPQFDVRAAVTRTLSRPDYFNLVPFERISTAEQTLVRGNPDLRHTTAWNYDLYVSLYNRLGLLTVGVYYKTLDDIDYIRQTRITEGEFSGYQFTFPENGEESNVVGLEIDLQTNLRFLPAPLDGVVLNANYAFADSETFFPFLEIGPRSPDPPFQPTLIDTARAAQIPGQARHVANVSVGYEKGGFSGRLSVQYLEKSLFTVGNRAELDGFTDDSIRWDLALSQRFSQGLSVFLNANNLSNHPERAFLGIEVLPTNEQIFGWTMDLGIKYKF